VEQIAILLQGPVWCVSRELAAYGGLDTEALAWIVDGLRIFVDSAWPSANGI